MPDNHVHLSVVSVAVIAAVVVITEFFLKWASVYFAAQPALWQQQLGAAFSWFA